MNIFLKPDETVTFYHNDSNNAYDFQLTNISDKEIMLNYEKFNLNMYCLHHIIYDDLIFHVFFTRYEVKKI